MFGLFKKATKKDKLEAKYKALLEKSRMLSTSSRIESFKVYAEAEEVLKEIEALENQ